MKLLLSESLKKRRVRKKLTQEGLARLIHTCQSRIAKMEAGDPTVSIDLRMKGLMAMGVTPGGIARELERKKV